MPDRGQECRGRVVAYPTLSLQIYKPGSAHDLGQLRVPAGWVSLGLLVVQGLLGSCAVLGCPGGLGGTMPVDRFWNLDTIGASVNSGKIGFTGRTRKVDTFSMSRHSKDRFLSAGRVEFYQPSLNQKCAGPAGLPVQFKG